MINWLDYQHDYPLTNKKPVSLLYKRVIRILAVLLFVLLYVRTIVHAKSNIKRAPFAHDARGKIFPDAEENLEEIISQRFTKSIASFFPGPYAANFLESIQEYCRSDAMHSPSLKRVYDCDIISLSFSGLHSQDATIPCEDESVMNFALSGDYAEFGTIPTALEDYYIKNKIPESEWFEPQYPLHSKFAMFSPFFNADKDDTGSELGPLPTLNEKLNLIAAHLQLNQTIFQDAFRASSGQSRSPPTTSQRSVDKNHHWDAFMLCEPELIEFSLGVFSKDDRSTWWIYEIIFERTAFNSNFYKSYVNILSGPGQPDLEFRPMLECVLCWFLFCFLLALPSGAAVIFGPKTLYEIYQRKGDFKKIIDKLFDPTGLRYQFTPKFKIFLENLGFFLTCLGVIESVLSTFYATGSAFALDIDYVKVPMFSYWLSSSPFPSTSTMIQRLILYLVIEPRFHVLASICYLIRQLEFSLLVPETAYVSMTILFSMVPVFFFFVVFSLLLAVFGLVTSALYGHLFPQFSSIRRAMWTLLLYAFSFGEASEAEEYVYPAIESGARNLQGVLLVFQILVVTVMLNLFTTIVMDGYAMAVDQLSSQEKMESLNAILWYRAKKVLGYHHQLEEELNILGDEPERIIFRGTVFKEANASPQSQSSLTRRDTIIKEEQLLHKMEQILSIARNLELNNKKEI